MESTLSSLASYPDVIISLFKTLVSSLVGLSVAVEQPLVTTQQQQTALLTKTVLPPVVVLDGSETSITPMEFDGGGGGGVEKQASTAPVMISMTTTMAKPVVDFASLILDPLLAAILVEDDLVPLTAYIVFLGGIMEEPSVAVRLVCLMRVYKGSSFLSNRLRSSFKQLLKCSCSVS